MELTWVDELPDFAEINSFDHGALAALARWYTGKWLAVPGLPPHYVDDIVNGLLNAYKPAGSFSALYRGNMIYISYVGRNPYENFTPGQFAPMRVAILDLDEIPAAWGSNPASWLEMSELALQLREGPEGKWAIVPPNLVLGPSTISKGLVSVFGPAGAFEAVTRKHQIYARRRPPR